MNLEICRKGRRETLRPGKVFWSERPAPTKNFIFTLAQSRIHSLTPAPRSLDLLSLKDFASLASLINPFTTFAW